MRTIYFTDDVNLADHASTIIYRDGDGHPAGIHIRRDHETEETFIYSLDVQLNADAYSWADLQKVNKSCDTDYKPDQEFTLETIGQFLNDLTWYYSPENFDCMPHYCHLNALEEYLQDLELIEGSPE